MNFRTIAGATMTLAALVLPLDAFGASAGHAYSLQTRIVEQSPGIGEFDGTMQLRVSSDGIVSGFYRPDDNMQFVSVTGGITGERFWLDIGDAAQSPMRFSGTLKDGRIDAVGSEPFLDDGLLTGLELHAVPRS